MSSPAKRTNGSSAATSGAYLTEELGSTERLPAEPITDAREGETDAVGYALLWAPDIAAVFGESYVNLIPDYRGRHARQWTALGAGAGGSRVL